jgi:hypothetical protein
MWNAQYLSLGWLIFIPNIFFLCSLTVIVKEMWQLQITFKFSFPLLHYLVFMYLFSSSTKVVLFSAAVNVPFELLVLVHSPPFIPLHFHLRHNDTWCILLTCLNFFLIHDTNAEFLTNFQLYAYYGLVTWKGMTACTRNWQPSFVHTKTQEAWAVNICFHHCLTDPFIMCGRRENIGCSDK